MFTRGHGAGAAIFDGIAGLVCCGARGGTRQIGGPTVREAGHLVVAGQFGVRVLEAAEVDRPVDAVFAQAAGRQFVFRGRTRTLLGKLRALHRTGRIGNRGSVRALLGGPAAGGWQPAAAGVGGTLRLVRLRGRALDVGRTLRIGWTLHVGGTSSAAATSSSISSSETHQYLYSKFIKGLIFIISYKIIFFLADLLLLSLI